jgi:hypothetical protein
MQITEFDFGTPNEQLQADYTRDFLTAVFAHEGIDDFIMWGFWENAHWRPDAAMYRSDWSIKPNGEAYLDLVFDEWWTDEVLSSDDNGLAELSGFKGEYEITISLNGETVVLPVTLTDGGLQLQVALPILTGDFDSDGDVDGRDYLAWQRGESPNPLSAGDLANWQAEYGEGPLTAASVAVPEPAAAGILTSLCILTAVFFHRTCL